MNATRQLHDLGQSIWLDNITRALLTDGTLSRYMRDFAVTGLTSNPTIFDYAIGSGDFYDEAIREKAREGKSGEELFFEVALEDLTRAADLLMPIHEATGGFDGWVSLEVSPSLADDAGATIAAAIGLHARARRPNLFIKIPGTEAGVSAIEDTIFAGVPVNVTLLFSREHLVAASEAYMRGLERRVAVGLNPRVASVASVFIGRWDTAVANRVPERLRGGLGIAVAKRVRNAYRDILTSLRWRRLAALGARPQRLLWASTGVKDPTTRDTFYIEALAVSDTINTIPEKTLLAFADHGVVNNVPPLDVGDAEREIREYTRAGIDVEALAVELQRKGVDAFAKSWSDLMFRIAEKSPPIATDGRS